ITSALAKRTRINGTGEEYEMEEDVLSFQNDECEFDDLCGDVTFRKGEAVDSEVERGSWDLLDGHVLARVFHFLRADIKSLSYAALTCKHWQSVVKFYKDVSRQVDFGAIAPNCSNSVVLKIMVRYVMRCVFGDPKKAPPPLERLSPEEAVSYLWKGEGSLVEELIQCMAPHMEDVTLRDLKAKIHAHDPSGYDDTEMKLRKSLLWLRDEVRNLPCTYKSRHDAAADLIHIYAYTKSFFRIRSRLAGYEKVTSPPVYITPLDLGPKYADKLGSGVHEYYKTYSETYCLGQLMFWHNQNAEPDTTLAKASRGCLSLPDVGSFYAKVQKPSRQRVYGPRTLKFMLARMEKQAQRPWPKDRIWSFKSSMKVVGSPMLDAVLHKATIDKEMVHWLKHRPPIYQAMWDS
ncbi:UNVERIFIED_CONTAM: Histone-lysine N-methyltransferase ATXR3, partial [Sesamum calycinum]